MKIFYLFILFATSILTAANKTVPNAENKTVFLISTPRSLSVGFLRMMEARGDFAIFHEPTTAPYIATHLNEVYDEIFHPGCFRSFREITHSIQEQTKHSHVFIKEVAFSFHNFLTLDNPLLQSAHFVFLMRKPQDVILSFYQRGIPTYALPQIIGFQEMYELYEFICAHAKHPPCLIFAEDLGQYPKETVSLVCKHIDIPFKPESLKWKDLGSEFTGADWRDNKKTQYVQYWHGDAIRSSGFVPLRTSAVDSKGVPTFIEIDDLDDRAACLAAYSQSLPYYLALKTKAKTPAQKS